MTDFNPKPPVQEAEEKPWVLGLLIGCIAILFIIGIRLAYDNADDTTSVATSNPPLTTSGPSRGSPPAETTGSGGQTQTSGSGPARSNGGGSSDRNTGAMTRDQDVNQTGDHVPGGTK